MSKVMGITQHLNGITRYLIPVFLPPLVQSTLYLTLRSGPFFIIFLAVALSGFILPFRSVVGPALWLLALFPFSHYAGLWSKATLKPYLTTLPITPMNAMLTNIVSQQTYSEWLDVVLVAFIVPACIVMLCHIFKSSFAVRLRTLIAWYAYFNVQEPQSN